jgi:hypothetical protein
MLSFDIVMQQQLVSAVLDDFSPNDALPDSHGGQYGEAPAIWREAVIEFVGAMLTAGLIAPLPGLEGYPGKTPEEICNMLRFGETERGLDAETLWDVIHFAGTEKLVTIMREIGLATWEAKSSIPSPALKKALGGMGLVAA